MGQSISESNESSRGQIDQAFMESCSLQEDRCPFVASVATSHKMQVPSNQLDDARITHRQPGGQLPPQGTAQGAAPRKRRPNWTPTQSNRQNGWAGSRRTRPKRRGYSPQIQTSNQILIYSMQDALSRSNEIERLSLRSEISLSEMVSRRCGQQRGLGLLLRARWRDVRGVQRRLG